MRALNIATCHLIEGGHASGGGPMTEVHGKCLYRNGDYSIYKHCDRAYYHLYKNVIITELCGPNRELIDCLANGREYGSDTRGRFIYNEVISDLKDSERCARIYNFKIQ